MAFTAGANKTGLLQPAPCLTTACWDLSKDNKHTRTRRLTRTGRVHQITSPSVTREFPRKGQMLQDPKAKIRCGKWSMRNKQVRSRDKLTGLTSSSPPMAPTTTIRLTNTVMVAARATSAMTTMASTS